MPQKSVLKDLREECECENVKYCPLEAIIEATQGSDRMYEQHKVVEKFKWEESKKEGYDIGWEESYKRYVKNGMAKLFAEVYKEGMKHREIYQGIIKRMERIK